MRHKKASGLRRLMHATRYSLQGIQYAWRNETAFRQELFVVGGLVITALLVGTTLTQRALLIFSSLLILMVELINSAIEAVVDRIGPEHHPLSGQAKNLGSAAVLLSLIAAGLVWALVVWERWF